MSGLFRVLYVPSQRLALTPLWLALRIAGPLDGRALDLCERSGDFSSRFVCVVCRAVV